MPTYRYGTTDYNQMAVKPADNDGMCFFDTSEDRLMTMYYGTLKSFFVKTDESTNISANHEVQTGYGLYFGSSAEGRIQYNGADMIVGLTISTGKLKLQCNSIDFMTLDPVNSSIAIDSRALNYSGASGQGVTFDNLNRPVLLSVLQCNAGIAAKLKNISYTGGINTGLVFDSGSNATFKQGLYASDIFEATGAGRFYSTLRVDGILDQNAPIMMGTNKINNDGSLTRGLWFASNGDGTFEQNLYVAGYIRGYDYLQTSSYIRAGTIFNCNGTDGYTGTINTNTNPNIICKGGLVTGFS